MQDIEGAVFHQRLKRYRDELGGILKLSPHDLREQDAAKAQETSQPPSQPSQPPSQASQPPSQASQPPSQTTQPPSQTTQPPSQASQPPSQASQQPQDPHSEHPETTQPSQTTSTPPTKKGKGKSKKQNVIRIPKKKSARKVKKTKKYKGVTGNKVVDMLFKDADPKFYDEIKEKYNQYSADVDYSLSETIDGIRGNEDMLTTSEVVFGFSRLAVNTRVF
jgi:hypothetical protein